jgi:hypothetical protein
MKCSCDEKAVSYPQSEPALVQVQKEEIAEFSSKSKTKVKAPDQIYPDCHVLRHHALLVEFSGFAQIIKQAVINNKRVVSR